MCYRWNQHPLKCPLSAICALAFHLTAVFLLLTHCGGRAEITGSSTPILALIGEDVILPCHLQPAIDVSPLTLEWARFDLNPRFVHVRRDGVELLIEQNPSYLGRTSLSMEKLERGDMSLTLSRVKLSDEGKYRCHIPAQGSSIVELVVGAVSPPVIIIKEITDQELVLQCESKSWYPEPEVLWMDGAGNFLSAEPTETLKGSDGLFAVSSRVTVEKRPSNSFTCRVQQRNITQTKEIQIQIQGDVCAASSGFATGITVVLVIGFLLFAVVFFVLWKRRKDKEYKTRDKKVTLKGRREEEEQLIKGNKTTEDLDCEKLQEKEEEKNDMQHVISTLEEQEKELEKTKNEHKSKLEKVKEEWRKNEEKLKKVNVRFSWNKDTTESSLLKLKIDLEKEEKEYEKYLENIEEKIQKSKEIVSKMEKLKKKVENQIDEIKNGSDVTQKQQVKKESGERKNKLQEVTDSCRGNKHNRSSPHLAIRIETENKETEHDGTDRNLEENMNIVPLPEEQKTEPESANIGKKSKKEEEKEKGEGKTIIQKAKDILPGKKHDKTNPRLKSESELENKETEHEKLLGGTEKNLEENVNMEPLPEEQKTEPESANIGKKNRKEEEKEKGEKKTKLQRLSNRLPWNKHDAEPELENKELEVQVKIQSDERDNEETHQQIFESF